jgi:hypothetical protein
LFATLSSFILPSPTLLSFEHPCLAMPYSKVPSPKMYFHVHEFLLDVSPSLTTIIISTLRHLSSSCPCWIPMSSNKLVDFNDFPYIESDPIFLHQCPPPQKFKNSYDCIG